VSLPDDEDFLMRPVLRGMCKLESILDGTLGIVDLAWANEALDVQDENERRVRRAHDRR